jgi:hypothetical protein
MHLPAMEEGEDVAVQGINMAQKMTVPPDMLSEVHSSAVVDTTPNPRLILPAERFDHAYGAA